MCASASAATDKELAKAYPLRRYRRGVEWLYNPADKQRKIDILVKHAKQDPTDSALAYDYLITQLKLFGLDGNVSVHHQ